ncbi:MAG: hypothetical protein LBB91_03485 [Clostridiales bacterium]|jgi:cellulose biosynthesis protein BcsQ|nr:hypothetical protein [Clostridiales bacterium]
MKIKLLIASGDTDYAEHLSNTLAKKYADTYKVSICSQAERLDNLLAANKYDIALLEPGLAAQADLSSIQLPILLMDDSESIIEIISSFQKIPKYQRISSIAGTILENYAESGKGINSFTATKARITAVWSPSGGSGKTTVALALAAHKVSGGKQAVYLSLESFSSTPVYFPENGKSISKAFEKLEANIQVHLMGIRQQDSGSGIFYFCSPENYDDMNILTANDTEMLVNACAAGIDELIIDLPGQCDRRVQEVLHLADTVLIICDPSSTSQTKLKQFIDQHNVFSQIQPKTILINNKGAKTVDVNINKAIELPLVKSTDPIAVYKTLSGCNFDY